MSDKPTRQKRPPRENLPVPDAARLLMLAGGTLAYTAAGWLDLLTASDGNALTVLGTSALLAGGTVLLLRSLLLSHPAVSTHRSRQTSRAARPVLLAALAALALCAVVTLAIGANLIASAGDTSIYDSDAAAFNAYNAGLVLHGQNPYTADAEFWDALKRFPSVGATPLHAGRYAGSTYGPSLKQVVADTRYEQTHPQARGSEYASASLHSYPALAFLVYVPGVWVGLPTTLYTSLLFLLAFFLAAFWGAPRERRPSTVLLLLASSLVVFWTLRGSFEVIALLPALLALRLLDRNPTFSYSKLHFGGNPGWLSPVLLGLACAVKQIVWPLVPLYVILIWKREGARAALRHLAVTLGAFVIPNLPFLLLAPGAWMSSMLLPITLPIFPSGVGLVGLARGGILPLLPPAAYALLELAALAALAFWLARTRRTFPAEMALILGLLPFALSWHSLFTYFMCIPALAVAGTLSASCQRAESPLAVEASIALAAEQVARALNR